MALPVDSAFCRVELVRAWPAEVGSLAAATAMTLPVATGSAAAASATTLPVD